VPLGALVGSYQRQRPKTTTLCAVVRDITDHSSVLRFVQHWQQLPARTRRDANAWPLLDFFDFGRTEGLRSPALPDEPPAPTSCTGAA
jgi:hypothetical protein